MDKVFQVIFMIIMTVGILGLPAYYVLNSRRKRVISEFEEEPENPVGLDSDELESADGDFDDKSETANPNDIAEYEPNGDITYVLSEDSDDSYSLDGDDSDAVEDFAQNNSEEAFDD